MSNQKQFHSMAIVMSEPRLESLETHVNSAVFYTKDLVAIATPAVQNLAKQWLEALEKIQDEVKRETKRIGKLAQNAEERLYPEETEGSTS